MKRMIGESDRNPINSSRYTGLQVIRKHAEAFPQTTKYELSTQQITNEKFNTPIQKKPSFVRETRFLSWLDT